MCLASGLAWLALGVLPGKPLASSGRWSTGEWVTQVAFSHTYSNPFPNIGERIVETLYPWREPRWPWINLSFP